MRYQRRRRERRRGEILTSISERASNKLRKGIERAKKNTKTIITFAIVNNKSFNSKSLLLPKSYVFLSART